MFHFLPRQFKQKGDRMKKAIILAFAVAVFNVVAFAQLKLNGAGATFPYIIYSKWFDVYSKKVGVQFNYQSIGSGGGDQAGDRGDR
jgi:ABC-type phosphate transport system substrate-binding protein